MSAGPRSGAPLVRLSLVLAALLIVAMVTYYYVAVRPWVANPDVSTEELERLWGPVVKSAEVGLVAGGSAESLQAALKALDDLSTERMKAAVEAWMKGGGLADEHRNAIQDAHPVAMHLVRWAAADGGFDAVDPCTAGESFDALTLFLVGRLTLAAAGVLSNGPPREDAARAVLHLSRAMRRGAGPVHYMAGLQLALHVLGAAERWEILPHLRQLTDYAPARREVVRMVQAEAYCVDKLVERHFSELQNDGWRLPTQATESVPRAWIEPGPSFFRRERLMLREYWGRRLDQALAGDPDDLERLAETIRLPEDPNELPRSYVVRTVVVDLSEEVREAAKKVDEYRRRAGF